jgi:hypothetical protein
VEGTILENVPVNGMIRKDNIKIDIRDIVICVVNGISSMSCSVAAL